MLGTHTEHVRTICDGGHRVDSIRKEIQKHLLELHSIGLHWGKIARSCSASETRGLFSSPSEVETTSQTSSFIATGDLAPKSF